MGKHLVTHGIGLIGALIFIWLDFPLPWLFGPLCSCLIAAVLGAQLTTVKIISGKAELVELFNTPIGLLNGRARIIGQKEARLPDKARRIDRF